MVGCNALVTLLHVGCPETTIRDAGGGGGLYTTDGLIWVAGSAFDGNNAVSGGGGILLDPTCATQVLCNLWSCHYATRS